MRLVRGATAVPRRAGALGALQDAGFHAFRMVLGNAAESVDFPHAGQVVP